MTYKKSILPSHHWEDWISRAEKRWPDHSTRIMQLQQGGLLPFVYPEIIVAFTAPARKDDNTATAPRATIAFAEIGYYQITAGSADRDAAGVAHGPWPKRTPSKQPNDWLQLHDDPRVVKALGRSATMVSSAWANAIDDQHAVGLASLEDYGKQASAKLPGWLAPSALHTPWGVWLTFMAFSAGAGGAIEAVRPFGGDLAQIDEKYRPTAHIHLAVRSILSGTWRREGSAGRHSNPAHRLLRTWQKFAFAEELSKRVGDSKAQDFFALRLEGQGAAHEDVIAREDQFQSSQGVEVTPISFPPFAATFGTTAT